MTTSSAADAPTLDKVRKLLAMAEGAATEGERDAFTAKASEMMARYGIERAHLGALHPETDKPADKIIDAPEPFATVTMNMLAWLANAMRCKAVLLSGKGVKQVHLFGYASDLERVDVLFTSLLLQSATALRAARPPAGTPHIRSWNRSFLMGFAVTVTGRVRAAEERAAEAAQATETAAGTAGGAGGPGTAVVLADRSLAVQARVGREYPKLSKGKVTWTGGGYRSGSDAGQRANIGGTGVGGGNRRALA